MRTLKKLVLPVANSLDLEPNHYDYLAWCWQVHTARAKPTVVGWHGAEQCSCYLTLTTTMLVEIFDDPENNNP